MISEIVKPLVEFPNQDENRLSEIFQCVDIKFSYVNDDGKQVIHPVKCRDFLGDMIWSRKVGLKACLYGLSYNYADNPYDTEVTRFSLKFPSAEVMHNFIGNFSFLNDKENKHGIPESILYQTDIPLTLIIEGDKVWQSNVWKLSLYTFFLKLMGYADPSVPKNPEHEYLKFLTPKVEDKFLSQINNDFDDTIGGLYEAHNYSGFYSAIRYPNYSKISYEILGEEWIKREGDDDDDDDCYDDDDEDDGDY